MSFTAANGQEVTDEMIEAWCAALDNDAWPEGWRNVGEILECGASEMEEGAESLTLYLPSTLKRAVDQRAASEGVSTSSYICGLLLGTLARDS